MRLRDTALAACLALAATACIENTAPGNDREAQLDPPEPPAESASAESAVVGVDVSLLHPQIMTEADLAVLDAECRFRFTRVGYPVLVHSPAPRSPAVIKLNGKLVSLERTGDGRFSSGGVSVRLRPVDADAGGEGQRMADLILQVPGARHELGYRGFSQCS